MTIALFEGTDANGDINPFVIDGENVNEITETGSSTYISSWGCLQLESTSNYFAISPDFTAFSGGLIFAGTDITGTGVDAQDVTALWITDGTQAGTHEITGITGASALGIVTSDLFTDFTVLGSEVLFAGETSSSISTLWVTNGTGAGTRALNITGAYQYGIFDVGLSSGSAFSPDFTVVGSVAVFWGLDSTGTLGLWVTDGTSPGTKELSGSVSFASSEFTLFGSTVLFAAYTSHSDLANLWATNGTAAGTTELASGPGTGGLFYSFTTGELLDPTFTILGNDALFEGYDASGHVNLWETNGTASGTNELAVSGAAASGLFNAPTSGYQVDFAVLGSEAVFDGFDANGHNNLWVTNGTGNGTTELSVFGAYSGGLSPSYLTAFGSEAVFVGYDASGDANLWVTNGTGTGTTELAVAGANSGGLFGTANPDFTVVGDLVTFIGIGSNGTPGVWETDGTSAGTIELSVSGASPNGLDPSNIAAVPTPAIADLPPDDFAGSGMSDLLLQYKDTSNPQDSGNGDVAIWLMNGTTITSNQLVAEPGANWDIVGTGDFNGDGKADLVWQYEDTGNSADPANGATSIWLMDGTSPTSIQEIAEPGGSWHVVGTGDFNGDGDADLAWQYEDASNASDPLNGETSIWLMNGTTPTSQTAIAQPGGNWHVVATGDFNGDGKSDLVWQYEDASNASDPLNGETSIWLMNGTTATSVQAIAQPGGNWHVVATGDFTGNGMSDLLWQYEDAANPADPGNGETSVWLMNGTTPTSVQAIAAPGANWHVIGTGDYTGNGEADILWQYENAANSADPGNGAVSIWLMNGTTPTSVQNVATPPASWHVL